MHRVQYYIVSKMENYYRCLGIRLRFRCVRKVLEDVAFTYLDWGICGEYHWYCIFRGFIM